MSGAPFRAGPCGGPTLGWRWLRLLLCIALPAFSSASHAQRMVGAAEQALPAVVRVGVPLPAAAPVTMAAGAGYGALDQRGLAANGHRIRSALALALAPWPRLSLGADVRGHWDAFPKAEEGNGYAEPRFTARYVGQAMPALWLGAEADVRLIGSGMPGVELAATSPSLRALGAYAAARGTWFAARLGYHFDRSARAVADRSELTPADRRTLNASDANALQWGVGISHRLPSSSELLLEVSGEAGVGSAAHSFAQSPSRLTVGVRHPLNAQFSVLAAFESGLSKRPRPSRAGRLLPMDPKLSALAALNWQLGAPGTSSSPGNAAATRPERSPRTATQAAAEEATTDDETAARDETATDAEAGAGDEETAAQPAAEDDTAANAAVAGDEASAQPDGTPPPSLGEPAAGGILVAGTVVDEGGRPLADVAVHLTPSSGEARAARTFADGTFQFANIAKGPVELSVATPGFDPATVRLAAGDDRRTEIVLRPAVPAGQLRGRVRDLAGNPIAAQVIVTPGDLQVPVQSDGSFEVELAPGKYLVRFRHPGHSAQQRRVEIAERGVVIVNIALTR